MVSKYSQWKDPFLLREMLQPRSGVANVLGKSSISYHVQKQGKQHELLRFYQKKTKRGNLRSFC